MIVAHVAVTCAEDYVSRREPYRHAHLERIVDLRTAGAVIAGGPSPDGHMAEIFYRLARIDQLAPLVEEDPYYRGGVWTAYCARSFSHFVEPWEQPPVVLDGSRRVSIVEGPAVDLEVAQLALVELRGAGRLAFGGCFDGAETLAVVRSPETAEAVAWLAESGPWDPLALQARPWLYVL